MWVPSGNLVKGQVSPDLISHYGVQRGLTLRPRFDGTVRARTQCKSISLKVRCLSAVQQIFSATYWVNWAGSFTQEGGKTLRLTKVLILLRIGKNCITRGSSQLLYFTYKLSLKHAPTAHIHHSHEEHTDFIRHSSSRVNILLEETTGKDWVFILKCWINFCSNTLEKQCEHRLSESLTFVRMYRATHIELCEKVCSGEHVYLYLYIYTHTLTSLLHAEESFLKS